MSMKREFWRRVEKAWDRLTEDRYDAGFRAGHQTYTEDIVEKNRQIARLYNEVREGGAEAGQLRARLEEEKARVEELEADLTQKRGKDEAEERRALRGLLAAIRDRKDGESVGVDSDGTVTVQPAACPVLESLQNPQQLPAEDRSEPPPGYDYSGAPSYGYRLFASDDATIAENHPYRTHHEATAAAWAHYDAIAGRAREQAVKLYQAELDETRKLLAKAERELSGHKQACEHRVTELVEQAVKAERERDELKDQLRVDVTLAQLRAEKERADKAERERDLLRGEVTRRCGERDEQRQRAEKAERERDEARRLLCHETAFEPVGGEDCGNRSNLWEAARERWGHEEANRLFGAIPIEEPTP